MILYALIIYNVGYYRGYDDCSQKRILKGNPSDSR